jgi:hypothetical protein
MTAPEEPDFSPSNALILCTDNVGLECKTWILMYSIGLCKDIFLQQIYDGEIMWNPITNEEVPEDSLWYFKPEWFNPTGKNKNKRKKEFTSLLSFHADSVVDSDSFRVQRFEGMGLGLMATNDNTVVNLANDIPGYLEYIPPGLFNALALLGHKSLYQYNDIHNNTQYCILYGPLSLVNSKRNIPVGFSNTDPTTNTELYYELVHTISYRTIEIEDEEDVLTRTYNISTYPFLPNINQPVYRTVRTTIDNNHPDFDQVITTRQLVSRVQMSWTGNNPSNSSHNIIREGDQIFINYKYVDIQLPQLVDLTANGDEQDEDH